MFRRFFLRERWLSTVTVAERSRSHRNENISQIQELKRWLSGAEATEAEATSLPIFYLKIIILTLKL